MANWTCGTCGRRFVNLHAREQHMDATGHYMPANECDKCELFFNSYSAVALHMDRSGHWNYSCRSCGDGSSTESERNSHEIQLCNYCAECDKSFQNSNNLRMHLNSRIHRGCQLQCPFCKAAYATATGLCHHLENGACPRAASLDRDTMYRFVRSKDPTGAISNKLLEWQGSSNYQANNHSWNGRGYECYLCHRTFTQLNGLNQHLNSPIHQQKLYHCPNRRQQCGKEFTSLAGLMNHLESESCGFTRFEAVQSGIKNVISGDRLITFG